MTSKRSMRLSAITTTSRLRPNSTSNKTMYQLDTQSAREAENVSAFLNETGKYIGTFTRAEKLISTNKGTHGIGITFETKSKQTTRFDLWTMDKDMKPLMGKKALDAIMACMKVRSIAPKPGKVDRWDYDTKKMLIADAEVFPDLTGKPIGLLLRNTEYEKMKDGQKTGETGWRLELYVPFDAATEMTASELLDRKTKAERLPSIVASLVDRPLKARPAPKATHQNDDGYGNLPPTRSQGSGFDEMDDDIPF